MIDIYDSWLRRLRQNTRNSQREQAAREASPTQMCLGNLLPEESQMWNRYYDVCFWGIIIIKIGWNYPHVCGLHRVSVNLGEDLKII